MCNTRIIFPLALYTNKKIEKEKDKARLSRDLALAAAQQVKQQTATVRQEKAAL